MDNTVAMQTEKEIDSIVQRRFELVNDAPKDTVLPIRKTANSAGYDFVLPRDVYIAPYTSTGIIATNVKVIMPKDEVLLLFIRSSIGIGKGVVLANGTGIIDADYANNPMNDGNIGIILRNESGNHVRLLKGERIMQGIFVKYQVTNDDAADVERVGGFGSTGSK